MRRCLVLAVAVTTAVPAVAEPEHPSLDIYVSAQGRTPTLDDAKVVAVERCYRERFGTQRKAGELRQKTLDATSLDVDTVTKKIQDAYSTSIHRCYRQQLAKTPDLRTTLQIAFTVDAGRATAIVIASGEPGLDACVKELVAAWRFPRPTVGDKPATARFELALALSPD